MKKTLIVFLGAVSVVMFYLNGFPTTGNLAYDKDEIFVPVSAHLVDDGTVQYTTGRNIDDVNRIFLEVNRIWSQGQITFIVADVDTIKIENKEFGFVFYGESEVLTKRDDFVDGMINIYFSRYLSANGISFPPQGFLIVGDITSVNDFRATAHELGHLLGLAHVNNPNYLMHSGTNGELLSQEEVNVARRNARRVYGVEI